MSAIPQEERIKYVGASEVAAICHQHPYKSHYQLWCEKKRLVPREDVSGKMAVKLGQRLEPFIADEWAATEGIKVRAVGDYMVHPDCPRYGASLDFMADDNVVVETKVVGVRQWQAWREAPPLHYELQLQAQMDCARAQHGVLVVLPLGFHADPHPFRYDARPVTQGRLLSEVEDFWRTVDRNDPPEPDYGRDARAVAAARAALLAEGGLSPTPLVTDDPGIVAKIARRQEIGASIREATGEKKALDAEIMAAMGEHKVLMAGPHKVSLSVIGEKLIPEHTRAGYVRMSVGKAQRLQIARR